MKKVIIVDDEMLVRVGLRTSINWEAYNFLVAGEARNGREAIEKFSELDIDLLITDIAMPEMDGLELSKYFLNINKDIEIIILTHHENFTYAKKAIDIGVNHYILKSDLDPEHFTEILKGMSGKESHPVNVDNEARYKNNEMLMKKCINDNAVPPHRLTFINDGFFLFKLKVTSGKKNLPDVKTFSAIVGSTLQSLGNEYYYLESMAYNKTMLVFDAINHDFKSIMSTMTDLKDNLENILNTEIKYDYAIKHYPVHQLFNQLLKMSKSPGVEYFKNENYPFYINKAFDYINNNYEKDISLSDVAGYCELNASYLSNLIRKETGITYSKYLNMLRIEEAKVLLETTNMKVYEVSLCVGIENQYYFGKLFKEITGLTCSDYRAKAFEKG